MSSEKVLYTKSHEIVLRMMDDFSVTQISSRMGCSNWVSILLAESGHSSPSECSAACSKTPGCANSNFQANRCPTGEGVAALTCYLYRDGCKEKSNTCWDLYTMCMPTLPAWILTDNRMGCSNCACLVMIPTQKGMSSGECGLLCQGKPRCEFNRMECSNCASFEVIPTK